MKTFVIIALCIVAALALPVDETQQQVANDESPLTIVELEPQDYLEVADDASRVKRHGGMCCLQTKITQ